MKEWIRKRKVMCDYDLTAKMYDKRYAEEQNAKFEAALEHLKMERVNIVLDVGCGTGLLFIYVENKAKMVVGLDISRRILFQAKERARKLQNVHLVLADADRMPFRWNMFNYTFAFTLIQNMPNPLKTLNEIKRVTIFDAFIVITALKKVFSLNFFEKLLRKTGLKILSFKGETLRCYMAICTRRSKQKPSKT